MSEGDARLFDGNLRRMAKSTVAFARTRSHTRLPPTSPWTQSHIHDCIELDEWNRLRCRDDAHAGRRLLVCSRRRLAQQRRCV